MLLSVFLVVQRGSLLLNMACERTHRMPLQVVPMLLYDLLLSPASTAATEQHGSRSQHQCLRAAALAAAAAAYVGIRQAVTGGQQLLTVFRKVSILCEFLAMPQAVSK